ncbi:MAG: hypothetical protein M0Q51_09585 [Bacteroidales bacterium]|nr:hypothetical protein [Bacteroidales bacterium]
MSTRAILAGIAGGIFAFLLGWLIFGMFLMDFYTANTTEYVGLMKETPNIVLILLSNLVWGLLFAFVFDTWAGFRTIGRGIVGGIILGLPIMLSFDLYFMAFMNLYSGTLIIVDVLANTIMAALMGGLIGFILGLKKKAA